MGQHDLSYRSFFAHRRMIEDLLRYRLVRGAFSDETLAALDSPVAELFRIEKSRGWGQIRESVHRLRQSVPPAEDSLRQAFLSWLLKVIFRD